MHVFLREFNFRDISLLSQSKFRRSGRLFPQRELWEANHHARRRRHPLHRRRRRHSGSQGSFVSPLRRKRHDEESCVACLTQFHPEEAAIAAARHLKREGRKCQPAPTSWLDPRCNSLALCRSGITRACNTPPLSLLMNNRPGKIVRDATALRILDLIHVIGSHSVRTANMMP